MEIITETCKKGIKNIYILTINPVMQYEGASIGLKLNILMIPVFGTTLRTLLNPSTLPIYL
jgi:hypothetical protein